MATAAPIFTVERAGREEGWAAFTVDPAGGVGPQASTAFLHVHQAEAWARAFGRLAEPQLEAA